MADQAEQLVPMQEQLKISFNELLLQLAPLAQTFISGLDALLKWKKVIVPFVAGITTLVTVLGTLIAIGKTVAFVMGLLGVGAAAITSPIWGTAAAITALVTALGAAFAMFIKSGSPELYNMPKAMG